MNKGKEKEEEEEEKKEVFTNTEVLLEHLSDSLADISSIGLNAISHMSNRLSHNGVNRSEGEVDVLASSNSTALPAVSTEGERGRPIPVLQRPLHLQHRSGTELEHIRASSSITLQGSSIDHSLEVLSQPDSRVNRDNGRGRLLGSETVVVGGTRDGTTDDVTMNIDPANHGAHEGDEAALGIYGAARDEEVPPSVGVQAPVIVLSVSVEAGKGLLVEEDGEAVAKTHLGENLHGQSVLISSHVGDGEDRGGFVLGGGNLIVEGAKGDSHGPKLPLDVLEEGLDTKRDRTIVIHIGLLTADRGGTNQRAATVDEIGAAEVVLKVNHVEFLLPADLGVDLLGLLVSQQGQEAKTLRSKNHLVIICLLFGFENL